MEVVGTKGSIALGALTLPGVIACFHTLKTEDMKALCEHSILFAHVTTRAGQAGLVILDFFHQYFITVRNHVRLLSGLQLPA